MSSKEAERHYKGQEGRSYHEGKRSIPDTALPWVARLRAEKIAPYVRSDDVVFEYGVGSGWNLAQLQCKRRLGYDIADFLATNVRSHGIEFVERPSSIPDASVNVAVCHHTLEHTMQPPEVLRELSRVLAPGGKLLLFVPYERERRYARFDPSEPNHHLYSWNVQTLGNLVQECGFVLAEGRICRFGYDRFAAVWADRLKLGETAFRMIRSLVHMVKPAYEVRIVAGKQRCQTMLL